MALRQLDSFSCPNCGAALEHKGNGFFSCPFCDSLFRDDAAAQPAEPSTVAESLPPELKEPTVANIKAIVLGELTKFAKDAAEDADALSIGVNPTDHPKLDKARASFGIPNSAEVWLIWDETFFGGCKYGFALTSEGIFSNYKENGGRNLMPWREFKSCSITSTSYTIHLNKLELTMTGGGAFEPVRVAMKAIQRHLAAELKM